MLQRRVYTVSSGRRELPDVELPLTIELEGAVAARLRRVDAALELELDRHVDRSELELVAKKGKLLEDGTRDQLPVLRLRDDDGLVHRLAVDMLSAISFLTDVPLSLSARHGGNRLLAEDDEDRATLARVGTDEVFEATSVRVESRTLGPPEVTAHHLGEILDRTAGLRIYADALKLSTDVARYRELWRVLESAFREDGDQLVRLLASYPPAKAMYFTEDELDQLHEFRGRASHAASRAAVEELIKVERECSGRLPRLKNLVERVILTKRSWGYPTTDVKELAPLAAYIRPDGSLLMSRTGEGSD